MAFNITTGDLQNAPASASYPHRHLAASFTHAPAEIPRLFGGFGFERCYRVVSAINAISIHEKLKRSGFDGESRLDEVRKAKDVLLDFIEIFSDIVNDAERHPERIVVGVDPRTGDLAQRFLSIKRQQPRTSSLATVSLEELSDLVEPEDDADRRRLLDYLRDLIEADE